LSFVKRANFYAPLPNLIKDAGRDAARTVSEAIMNKSPLKAIDAKIIKIRKQKKESSRATGVSSFATNEQAR